MNGNAAVKTSRPSSATPSKPRMSGSAGSRVRSSNRISTSANNSTRVNSTKGAKETSSP